MLEGLNAISEYIGKSVNTTATYITKHGLPATKTPEGHWLTHKSLVLQWIFAGHKAVLKQKHNTVDVDAIDISDVADDPETREILANALMEMD